MTLTDRLKMGIVKGALIAALTSPIFGYSQYAQAQDTVRTGQTSRMQDERKDALTKILADVAFYNTTRNNEPEKGYINPQTIIENYETYIKNSSTSIPRETLAEIAFYNAIRKNEPEKGYINPQTIIENYETYIKSYQCSNF